MTIYFAPIARLLGDLVVSFPPLQSLIKGNEEVCLVLRSSAQEGLAERIPGLSKTVKEVDFLKLDLGTDSRVYNLRDHRLQTDYVWGSPEFNLRYPGYRIGEVIRDICNDFGILHGQENLEPLKVIPRDDCRDRVILIPGTAGPFKRWPSSNWLRLAQELLFLRVSVVLIGEPRYNNQVAELMKAGLPWVPTQKLADALDAISSARGVVAVDTGLMHLAVHQGLNTVALFRENTMFLRDYPNVKYIVAAPCVKECREKEFDFSPNSNTTFNEWSSDKIFEFWSNLSCQKGQDEGCMSLITVESVLELMQQRSFF
ncbi:MAG: hypothetical protein K2X81_04050 [Candidatus Obscuribacterales bacterium]|nr:hypothetical protein [Candidatus Obscuribacterales bacterium]